MQGSGFGQILRMTTWGESHGPAIGVVVDGCPAGLSLSPEDIQAYLDRRRPGRGRFASGRKEDDRVEILSGVFAGRTEGTPISMLIRNRDSRPGDYDGMANVYRPGHADWSYTAKYGFRDYRGGGRSSGRETAARVAAGAVAAAFLREMGITVTAYTERIGAVSVREDRIDMRFRDENRLAMPDQTAAQEAEQWLEQVMACGDSAGGIIRCVISGVPAGIGDPVFEKCSANLAKAICSIGAVKGFEIGAGFAAAGLCGSEDNDALCLRDGQIEMCSNHAGGILGGITDGADICFRAAIKATPSISRPQNTVDEAGSPVKLEIRGRHDPVIVPRAVVVVESMAAFVIADMLLANMTAKMDQIRRFYGKDSEK